MKIEVINSFGKFIGPPPFGSRILSEALLRDDRFDVKFNMSSPVNDAKICHQLDQIDFTKVSNGREHLTKLLNLFVDHTIRGLYSLQNQVNTLPETVSNDIVLYSANNDVFDIPVLMNLLNRGHKVVVGGPSVLCFDLKSVLISKGCRNIQNLLIVKGYVDLTTNLYSIIKRWNDVEITNNDFSTFWECDNNFIDPYYDLIIKATKRNPYEYYLPVIFESSCFWNKCKFCTYKFIKPGSFVKNVSPSKVANYIIKSCAKYHTNKVYVYNDYFLFDSFSEKVFDIINENGINVRIYTGIKMLNNEDYVKKIDRYIRRIFIGIESFDDFSLDFIRKGYNRNDIESAFNNILKICKSKLDIYLSVILDLPVANEASIYENYHFMKYIKTKMLNTDDMRFQIPISPKLIDIGISVKDAFIDGRYLKEALKTDEKISGRSYLWEIIRNANIDLGSTFDHKTTPIQKFGTDGKIIDSEINLLPDEILRELMND